MTEPTQLVEVNGSEVRDKSLNDVIPMLQGSDEVIRLKLARLMSIPERDFNTTMSRSSRYALAPLATPICRMLGCVISPPGCIWS